MKKLLLISAFGMTTFLSATNYSSMSNFNTERVYTWTSTCEYIHTTTFTGDWSLMEMGSWIADANKLECGIRPNVIMPITSDMT